MRPRRGLGVPPATSIGVARWLDLHARAGRHPHTGRRLHAMARTGIHDGAEAEAG